MSENANSEVISGFKGFNRDMTCRDFQYKEGESYETDSAEACSKGFHFCENPIDVFGYYAPGESVFHEVVGSGQIDRHDDDSKVACTNIKIGASIKLHDLIDIGIKFFFSRKYEETTSKHSTGDSSASSATGDRSASVCTGLKSKAMAGKYGCIALAWWNEVERRGEMRCAETGCGDGSDGKLKAEVWYRLDDGGQFVECGE